MTNRYETGNEPRRSRERPRDEFGRFEPEPDRDDRRFDADDLYGRREEAVRSDYYRPENDGSRRYDNRFDMQRDDRGLERANREENRSRQYNDWNTQSPYRGYNDRVYNDRAQMNQGRGSRGESEYLGYSDERANGGRADSQYGDGRSSRTMSGGGYDRMDRNSQRGQHAGKGPKGYRRSDDRIQEDVNEALSQHSEIDATEIEVKVSNGEVTLSGTVTDRQSKRLAEDIAERCSGVQDVRNDIRVQRDSESGNSQNKSKPATSTGHKNAESKSA